VTADKVDGVADWDGRGLPPVAAERARRAAAGGAWTSLLTVPAAVGLEACGVHPVGEVMGSMVQRIGWTGAGGCGAYGNYGLGAAAQRVSVGGYRPYVEALNRGYATAMRRMLLEASTIGADGVVGVQLTMTQLQDSTVEFTALGTGVQARSRTRPKRVFSTALSGQDVAKLLVAGWVPVDLVFGITVMVRHDDWAVRQQTSPYQAGNVEVDGYTQLITRTRANARERFGHKVREAGADGAIVSSMALRAWSVEPSNGHRDHVAEASVFGTALARFHRSRTAPTRTLTFLPLK
jgi:uncharacterized protein YbjQ (UPF0145 family)